MITPPAPSASSGTVGDRCGVSKACTVTRSRCPFSSTAPVGNTSTSTPITVPGSTASWAARVNGCQVCSTSPSRRTTLEPSTARWLSTCQPPVSRSAVPSGATSSTCTESIPSFAVVEAYSRALIGPITCTGLVRGAVS